MVSGGCVCGNLRYEYTGEPQMKAICHCGDCRKITGSTYSTNILIEGSTVKWTKGTPKEWTKTADSGKPITSYFCDTCGTTCYRTGPTFGVNYVIKAGTIDDHKVLETDGKPAAELYASERLSWVASIPDANDLQGMS